MRLECTVWFPWFLDLYSTLNTNATTVLVEVGANYQVIPVVTTFASIGVKTDIAIDTYPATNASINTLTPVDLNLNLFSTRSTATLLKKVKATFRSGFFIA